MTPSSVQLLNVTEPMTLATPVFTVVLNQLTSATGLKWYVQVDDYSERFLLRRTRCTRFNIYVQDKIGPYHPADYTLVHVATSEQDAMSYLKLLATYLQSSCANMQKAVDEWLRKCLPHYIPAKLERTARFAEEAIELCQATGASAEDMHAMVDYVFNRPKGEVPQEVAGTLITLAALCNHLNVNMVEAFATEMKYARTDECMEKVRNRQPHKLQFKGYIKGSA